MTPPTRALKRRQSETAILAAARERFAADGFERTTIRGVAAAAGVDPALVMQHFDSKQRLFAAAARWETHQDAVLHADRSHLPAAAIDDMLRRFEHAPDREAVLALLRSCLTHPEAARVVREQVLAERSRAVVAAIDRPDGELRAEVLSAVVMGLVLTRYLLEVPAVAKASEDELRRIVEPVLAAALGGTVSDAEPAAPLTEVPGAPR